MILLLTRTSGWTLVAGCMWWLSLPRKTPVRTRIELKPYSFAPWMSLKGLSPSYPAIKQVSAGSEARHWTVPTMKVWPSFSTLSAPSANMPFSLH